MRINKIRYWIVIGFILGILSSCTSDNAEVLYPTNDEGAEAYFVSTLQSTINSKCISCHTYHDSGDVLYDTYGKTKASIAQMLERINLSEDSGQYMPPVGESQLTEEEKQQFQTFLNILNEAGADEEETPGTSSEEEELDEVKLVNNIKWTAYKYQVYRNRDGVSGGFDEVVYNLNEDYVNPIDVLDGASVEITPSSVNIDGVDGTRTINVRDSFFATFMPDTNITAEIVSYNDIEANINITMNGVEQLVSFLVFEESDRIFLIGSIENMGLFNWSDAYASLAETCGSFHILDGETESKVWPDIDLEIEIPVQKYKSELTWTAYKYAAFSNRDEVSGTFDDIEYTLNNDYVSPIDILDGAEAVINTSSVNIDGVDGLRTMNVADSFFAYFTPDIFAKVIGYTNDEAIISISMNGIEQEVKFEVIIEEENLILDGFISDLSFFNWGNAYEQLDITCGGYHALDGEESKVWGDVDLQLTIPLN